MRSGVREKGSSGMGEREERGVAPHTVQLKASWLPDDEILLHLPPGQMGFFPDHLGFFPLDCVVYCHDCKLNNFLTFIMDVTTNHNLYSINNYNLLPIHSTNNIILNGAKR